jgi:predicted HTH transcriptional regulator
MAKMVLLYLLIGEKVLNSMNEEEEKGYFFLMERSPVNKREYASHFGFDEKKAQRHLSKFKKLGLIQSEGNGPATRYTIITKGQSGQ